MFRLLLGMATLFCAGSAFGLAGGVDSRTSFETVGCGSSATGADLGCHVKDPNAALTVTIEGPVQFDSGPLGFGTYTVSIPVGSQSQGLMGAGMNVEIAPPNSAGCVLKEGRPPSTMAFRNESLDPNDPVLSHDYSGPESTPTTLVGVWSYQFLVLNCQDPGPLVLLAAMNAFDGSGDETGEVWNLTQLDVTVPEPGADLVGAGAFAALRMLNWGRSWRR
jgi:hypothetical protein